MHLVAELRLYWKCDFLRAILSHHKGTTSARGNHTIRYVSVRFDTIPYDSPCSPCALPSLTACPGGPRWTFPVPLSATRLPTMPHISFQLRSECINSAPLVCIHRIGKSFVKSDWCTSFDVCESKNGKFFVLLPRFGMAGGVGLLMLYFISVCLSCSLMWCKLLVISLWERDYGWENLTILTSYNSYN